MAVITVFGSGIMATALVTPLADNGHEAHLAGAHPNREIITSIQETDIHPSPSLKVPDGVTTHQLEDAPRAFEGVKFVMSGINSFGVDQAGDRFASLLRPEIRMIALAKDMQADDGDNLTILPRILASRLPEELRSRVSVSAIAGSSIAGEVAVHRHTSVIFTGEDPGVLTRWRGLFAAEHYHVWTNTGSVGVEVCVATKNCYAFGAGFMQGLLGATDEAAGDRYVNYNYGMALFGQTSVGMIQFMEPLGGKPITPIGLPGISDCFVTSMGGRNVRCGWLVRSGMTSSQVRAQMPGVTLEGVVATVVIGRAVVRLTERGTMSPGRFPLLHHLCEVVGLDRPVATPQDNFFGDNGPGRV